MKRSFSILAATLLSLGLAACDKSAKQETQKPESPQQGSNEQQSGSDLPDHQGPIPSPDPDSGLPRIQPRPLEQIPQGTFGDKVRQGYQLFVNTQQLKGRYVGNDLNCVNCHLDAGRRAGAAPLWAAYFSYPAYRKKNDRVNSFAERIQGCFTYSQNGAPPPKESAEIRALSAYAYWLAVGGMMDHQGIDGKVPEISDADLITGARREDFPLPEDIAQALPLDQRDKLPGRGYPKLDKPGRVYSLEEGAEVYAEHCAGCHGGDGQGSQAAGIYNLPPLWGKGSYNWGAGMHRVNTAAAFIYTNMPLGKGIQLTLQQAWDVAAYINSHERPQDPRLAEFGGDVEKLRERYHQNTGYYGEEVDGKVLGEHSFPDFRQLQGTR
ncbi:c-type cytochrome [Microbulbifer elongatus]|uniref:C-type cytochrome n=1 Tax=Microbulbifer elongatus TaxID=86173 RepID=A0ABT1NXE2_9GAMM|nr:c-type cytochrome [Microbulbifer elongatus]MCQ3828471.1 c-type cytochrome [Microbulbifer elongatus]